jgi:hypothetical protein
VCFEVSNPIDFVRNRALIDERKSAIESSRVF